MNEQERPMHDLAGDRALAITEGEWAGWSTWTSHPFQQSAGPFFQRLDEDGNALTAFRPRPEHCNAFGLVHGGCLMTFADAALFNIAGSALHGWHAVTVHFSSDFLGGVKVGAFVEARGTIARAARTLVFLQGIVTGDGEPALSFTGIVKKTRER